MEERMTLCNMVIEAGGKNGVVPADSTTFKYLEVSAKIIWSQFTAWINVYSCTKLFSLNVYCCFSS